MADFDSTALNATIKELWDEKVEEARYAKMVIANHISNKSGIAEKKGDVIHVTIDQKYTVGTVSAGAAFTPQTTHLLRLIFHSTNGSKFQSESMTRLKHKPSGLLVQSSLQKWAKHLVIGTTLKLRPCMVA